MNMEALLEIEDVWKKYDMDGAEPLVVLKEINATINKGDFVAIVGPSGSGKSTMMHIVGALDRPSWGKVSLKKKDISELGESGLAQLRGKTIGFIFQQFNLIPTLSALENVMLPMEIFDESTHVAKERAEKLLKILDLGNRFHHKPNQLSGGQQQRVAIARALSNNPDIILADEPTGNLDSKTGMFVIDFLTKLNKEGKTIILITHDMGLIKNANKVIKLMDGRIIKESKK